jgi:hypothetical protein
MFGNIKVEWYLGKGGLSLMVLKFGLKVILRKQEHIILVNRSTNTVVHTRIQSIRGIDWEYRLCRNKDMNRLFCCNRDG